MKIILISLFLILSKFVFSQSGWIQQDSGTNDSLHSVRFLNLNKGWTVGTNGIVLKTTNGGSNWITVENTTSKDLHSIFITSDSSCYASGDSGLIIKTTNEGSNWTQLSSGVTTRLNSVFFINQQTGFVSGSDGTIIKTTNSGNSWSILASNTDIQLNAIYFANSRRGWVCGYGGIYSTTNGGSNWAAQFVDGYLILNSICFVDSLHGWTAYYDNLTFGPENVKTTDGGLSWINYSMNNKYSISIYFINENKGWSSGFYGNLMYSTNGGTSWTLQVSGTGEHLRSLYFTDSLNGWAVGDNGKILRTITGGIITSISSPGNEISKNFFLEQNYPNPFNPVTNLKFGISGPGLVSLKIYDMLGEEIITLVNSKLDPGTYDYAFDASTLSSGIYFYTLKVNEFIQTKKMVLLK